MVSRIEYGKRKSIVMTYLTEEEEAQLDEGLTIVVDRGNTSFVLSLDNVYCYGIIDFSDISEDLDTIAEYNWLDNLVLRGVLVPSNYNYEEHVTTSDTKYPKFYDTTRPDIVAQYSHGILGKPKRTVIFKL